MTLPDQKIQVAVDYANHKTSNAQVQAYAKLAGSSWTYYVQSLNVVIGRTSDPVSDDNDVQIDLGPAKVVSRKHATIQYNGEFWELTVSGRNGVKVDKVSHKEGSTRLYSGNILDIGGVQMMFVLPDTKPRIAPGFRKKLYQLAGGYIGKTSNPSIPQERDPFQKESSSERPVPLLHTGSFESVPNSQYHDSFDSQSAPAEATPYFSNSQQSQSMSMSQFPFQNNELFQNVSQRPMPQDTSSGTFSYSSIPAGYTSQFSTNIPVNFDSAPINSNRETAYPKGVAIVSQPQVRAFGAVNQYLDQDLSSEDAKDIKPPFSYATMISQAILSTDDHMMSLSEIYDWISSRYSFYRFSKSGWQNSIRHNLSLNKAFEKVPRKANEPGKGMKWQIVSQYKEEFQKKASQGDHIKGKSTIAQMQRQVQLRYSAEKSAVASAAVSNTFISDSKIGNSILTSAEAMDVEAATVVANLATSPRERNFTHDMKAPLSPVTIKHEDTPVLSKDASSKIDKFSTPRKQSIRGGIDHHIGGSGNYSDQYGFNSSAVISDTPNGGALASLSTPSPSHRYPTGQISQLEAYTPDRGSNNGKLPSWRGGLPPSVTKIAEMTPLNKMITTESLTRSLANNSSSSTISSMSTTSTISNPTPNSKTVSTSHSGKADHNSKGNSSSGSNTNINSATHIVGSVVAVSQTPAHMQSSNLQLMAPTSAQQQQLPSSFMPASSPAPFWRFMQLSSTPVRANDFSPTKFSSPPVSSALTPEHISRTPAPRGIGTTGSSSGAISATGANKNSEVGLKRPDDAPALGDLKNVDLTR